MHLNLLKYMTFTRVANLFKVMTGYLFSILLKKPVVWGVPPTISLEPTNLCNLQCPECPTGNGTITRPSGTMKYHEFTKIIDQSCSGSFYLQLFFQGEPFLNKKIFDMISYAKAGNMYVSVSTNGQLIDYEAAEKLIKNPPDKIIFSIDGTDEYTYQNYRSGGSLNKALSAVKILSEMKKNTKSKYPVIEFQMIVMKENEHLVKETEKYAGEIGADLFVCKSMQIYNCSGAAKFLPDNKKYSRYYFVNGNPVLKNKLHNRCFALWRTAVITWDGRIVPCCFDKNADYESGILNGKSLKDVWQSYEFNSFRDRILHNRKSVNICTNCSEGMKTELYSKNFNRNYS